jgi:excisionase family DNA binding protein
LEDARRKLCSQQKGTTQMPGFVTVQAAAEMLGVCRGSIYPLWWRGELDTVKVGRRRLVSEASIARAKVMLTTPDYSRNRTSTA